MQQQEHFILQCKIHPQQTIVGVDISQSTGFNTRFGCLDCIRINHSSSEYVSVDQFHKKIEFTMDSAVKSGNQKLFQINSYLTKKHREFISFQTNLVKGMQKLISSLKETLKNNVRIVAEFEKDALALRKVYEEELGKVKTQWKKVEKTRDYHESQEWMDLEQLTETYVQLYYKDEPQINTILNKLQTNKQQLTEQQYLLSQSTEGFLKELSSNLAIIRSEPEEMNMLPNLKKQEFWKSTLMLKVPHTLHQPKLIYKGTRDGLNSRAFWKWCENSESTLIICHSKSGAIFGGYTPCKWLKQGNFTSDSSTKSFVFSFTREEIYPLKTPDYSIYCKEQSGPIFGGGEDAFNIDADFQAGQSKLGPDCCYSTQGYEINDPSNHLMNGRQPNLIDMEVYICK